MFRSFAVRLGACAAVLAAAAACGGGYAKPKNPVKYKVRKFTEDNGSKGRFMEVRVKTKADGAFAFEQPPYEIGGAFRVDLTAGLFREKGIDKVAEGFFGVRVDHVDEDEYYALSCEWNDVEQGLDVFAVTHDGGQGDILTFSGRMVLDLAIVSDGADVSFLAGDAGTGAYATVATVAFASPNDAHLAGFGMWGIDGGGRVGFSNFGIPQNTGPTVTAKKSVGGLVQQAFLRGGGYATAALAAVNRPVPNEFGAYANNDAAIGSFEQAKLLAEGLPEGRDKKKVIKNLERVSRFVGIASGQLGRGGDRGKAMFIHYMTNDAFPAGKKVHKFLDRIIAGGG